MWYKLKFEEQKNKPKFITRLQYLELESYDRYFYVKLGMTDEVEEAKTDDESDPQKSLLAMSYDESPNNLRNIVEQQELRELGFGPMEYPFVD